MSSIDVLSIMPCVSAEKHGRSKCFLGVPRDGNIADILVPSAATLPYPEKSDILQRSKYLSFLFVVAVAAAPSTVVAAPYSMEGIIACTASPHATSLPPSWIHVSNRAMIETGHSTSFASEHSSIWLRIPSRYRAPEILLGGLQYCT